MNSKESIDKNVEIKICGITNEYELDALIEERVEYAGFVMYFPKSKRNNSVENAKKLVDYARKKQIECGYVPKLVAVVVSPDEKQIAKIKEIGFDIIQIHGDISYELIKSIDLPVFRAYNVKAGVEFLQTYSNNVKGVLLDAAIPGQGETFDWNEYTGFDRGNKKFILAGGLDKDNIRRAIEVMSPDIVDCSSGVEYKDRLGKDIDKIHAFVMNARS